MCWDQPQRGLSAPGVNVQPAVDVSQWPSFTPQAADCRTPWLPPSNQLPDNFASFLRDSRKLQFPLGLAQLNALKQPRQVETLELLVAKAHRPTDTRTYEPRAKRLAIDLNFAVEPADEDEGPDDVTEEVPDEVISQILGCLADVKDRMSCALVCRRWLHVLGLMKRKLASASPKPVPAELQSAASAQQAATVSLADSADVVSGLSRTLEGRSACDARLMAMAIALSEKGGLEKLVIRGSKTASDAHTSLASQALPLTASGFQAIAQASPNLRAVAIWDCDWLDDETIAVLARYCRSLEKVDVMNCPKLSDKALAALSRLCPHLSVLSLASSRMVSDHGLQVLARGCKKLTSLSLSNCPQVMGKGVGVLAATCKKLTAIKLAGGLGLTDEGFRFIGTNASGLQRLRLYQLKQLTELGFRSLGETEGFRRLNSLSVAACCGLTSAALDSVGRGCCHLKSLGLVSCPSVTDDGILSLLQNAHGLEALSLQMLPGISNASARFALGHGEHLKSLTISNCPGVSDSVSGAADWTIRCPDLSTLKVANCTSVGDQCLTSMGKAGASLASLDLCGLPSAGDKGVLAFLQNSTRKLSSIDLSGCQQMSDKVVASIAERCGESVRSLCLDGCSRVTDKGVRALAKHCTAVEDLDLSKCDITDRGLKVLLNSVGHSLVNLSLAGCVRITDRSVEEIMDVCQSLSGLNLKNCSGLSKKVVEKLRQHAVNLFGPTCLFIDP